MSMRATIRPQGPPCYRPVYSGFNAWPRIRQFRSRKVYWGCEGICTTIPDRHLLDPW